MPRYQTNTVIQQLKSDQVCLLETTERELNGLTQEQLHWSPESGKWSIAQCLEHLNLTSRLYFPRMEKAITAIRETQGTETFKAGFFGEMMVNGMRPKTDGTIPRPMKTFKWLDPSKAPVVADDPRPEFTKDMQQNLQWIDQLSGKNVEREKVVSAVGPLLKFKLIDCFRFLMAHHLRHIQQIKNIKAHIGFPA